MCPQMNTWQTLFSTIDPKMFKAKCISFMKALLKKGKFLRQCIPARPFTRCSNNRFAFMQICWQWLCPGHRASLNESSDWQY